MSVAGIILAAGESRRMGSPKALLRYEGQTFAARLAGLLERHCAPVIVVLGDNADGIRAGAELGGGTQIAVNPEYARGQISSLQCGLRAVPPGTEGFLFTLVDHPAVREETIAELARPTRALLRIPRYKGRRGHPVYAAAALAPEFLAEDGSARDVVERHAGAVEYVDVDDPGVVADIDDTEAYARLMGGGV